MSLEKNAMAFPRERVHIAFDSQDKALERAGGTPQRPLPGPWPGECQPSRRRQRGCE